MDTLARQELTRSLGDGLRSADTVRYFKGRCREAITDYLKNPAHSSRCMRTVFTRGAIWGIIFFNFIYSRSTANMILVCPDALILNKVGSAIKLKINIGTKLY
jgi:hypothetical protein